MLPNLVKIGPVVLEKKMLTHDGRRTPTHSNWSPEWLRWPNKGYKLLKFNANYKYRYVLLTNCLEELVSGLCKSGGSIGFRRYTLQKIFKCRKIDVQEGFLFNPYGHVIRYFIIVLDQMKECTQHVVSWWYTHLQKFGMPMSRAKTSCQTQIHCENIILILRSKVKVKQSSGKYVTHHTMVIHSRA